MKTVPVEVHVADLKPMRRLLGAVAGLVRALAAVNLPAPAMDALDELRTAIAEFGGPDIGPPPEAPAPAAEPMRIVAYLAGGNTYHPDDVEIIRVPW